MTEQKEVKKSDLKTVAESAQKTKSRDEEIPKDNIVEMSNGIVFRVKEVPQAAFVDLRGSFPEPTPPVHYNKDIGREETNVNDPRYKAQLADWEISISAGMIDIQIIFGVEVVSVPDNMINYDDPDFHDLLKVILGRMGWKREDINDLGKTEKMLLWVKYYAAKGSVGGESDFSKLLLAIGRRSGVPEEDVKTAVDNFQG